MKIIYKKSIINQVEKIKIDAFNKGKIIEKIILTKEEWVQAKEESYGLLYPNSNLEETICGIPFEVEKWKRIN